MNNNDKPNLARNEMGRENHWVGIRLVGVRSNRDGVGASWLDVVVTNFSHETNTLYRGNAEDIFIDVTYLAGLGVSSIASLGWGVGLVDLDNNGWRDLFVANGHVYPEVDEAPIGTSWLQKKQLFLNEEGRFRDATAEVGGPLLRETSSRGVAFGDYDDDSDDDIFIVNLDAPPSLLRNDNDSGNHWLWLRLVGRGGNRDAIGARVTVDGKLREVRSGGSYLSHNDARLGFGLGSAETLRGIEVRWPGGKGESFETRVHDARSFRFERLRGCRGRIETGAPVLRRERRARAHTIHRAARELSRQYARSTRSQRPRTAPRPVRANAC